MVKMMIAIPAAFFMFTLFIHRADNLPISMAANGRDPFERGEYVHLTVAIGPVKWSLLGYPEPGYGTHPGKR